MANHCWAVSVGSTGDITLFSSRMKAVACAENMIEGWDGEFEKIDGAARSISYWEEYREDNINPQDSVTVYEITIN